MEFIKILLFFVTFYILFIVKTHSASSSDNTFNVVNLGADPKGIKKSTPAFLSAWSGACSSSKPAVILVPEGTFSLGLTQFLGPCKNSEISIQIKGTLVAPTDFEILGSQTSWIYVHQVNGVSIQGGVLDGNGKSLWDCKNSGKKCPIGSSNLGIFDSHNVNITSLRSENSQFFHIKIEGSQNVKVDRLTSVAPGNSPNTDGIHIQASSLVSIFSSNFSTGDDCISVGQNSSNLWIEHVSCGPGHGISIGSIGSDPDDKGVHNVTVKSATFEGTENGVRIKTWAKPGTAIIQNITFQNATMQEVNNPIIIDQNYCPGHGNPSCGHQPSGIQINNVKFKDIHGTSSTKVAVKFDCSTNKPCTDLQLENINLKYNNGGSAESSCANAFGESSGIIIPPSCLKTQKKVNLPFYPFNT